MRVVGEWICYTLEELWIRVSYPAAVETVSKPAVFTAEMVKKLAKKNVSAAALLKAFMQMRHQFIYAREYKKAFLLWHTEQVIRKPCQN